MKLETKIGLITVPILLSGAILIGGLLINLSKDKINYGKVTDKKIKIDENAIGLIGNVLVPIKGDTSYVITIKNEEGINKRCYTTKKCFDAAKIGSYSKIKNK